MVNCMNFSKEIQQKKPVLLIDVNKNSLSLVQCWESNRVSLSIIDETD